MRVSRFKTTLLLLFSTVFCCTAAEKISENLKVNPSLEFIPNKGQIVDSDGNPRPDIKFVTHIPGATLYFTSEGIHYLFTNVKRSSPVSPLYNNDDAASISITKLKMLMELQGSNKDVVVLPRSPSNHYSNYYLP